MEAASRMAFELEMWRTDALQIGAIKTTEHWVEAAFEAGYKAAMTVAAEPHSDDDRLRDVLHSIGDMAHDASTGPAVPDVLWEIRRMAYDEI
jgi:hypothetical protein